MVNQRPGLDARVVSATDELAVFGDYDCSYLEGGNCEMVSTFWLVFELWVVAGVKGLIQAWLTGRTRPGGRTEVAGFNGWRG